MSRHPHSTLRAPQARCIDQECASNLYSLLSGCVEFLLRKEELHVLLVGLDRAGKTTLLERLKTLYTDVPGLESDKVVPTVGLNLAHFEALGSPLLCWDVGGAAGLRSIWSKYYGECHGLVFVVDAADAERLDEAKLALERALGERAPALRAARQAGRCSAGSGRHCSCV